MRALMLAALLLFVSSLAAAATPAQTVDAFHAALRDRQPDRAVALLAPEALIYEQGFAELSRADWMRNQLGPAVAFAADTQRKLLRRESRQLGDVAWVVSSTQTTVALAQDPPLRLNGAETAILRRDGDRWVIVHLHWSAHEEAAGP
ncbi:YybH family protein [Panacagrimonas sp.]|uniref:YybH family protein n=1 Tax=Panacagrimonas sp. TaxID=2480088 RepID=UPI003B51B6D7